MNYCTDIHGPPQDVTSHFDESLTFYHIQTCNFFNTFAYNQMPANLISISQLYFVLSANANNIISKC